MAHGADHLDRVSLSARRGYTDAPRGRKTGAGAEPQKRRGAPEPEAVTACQDGARAGASPHRARVPSPPRCHRAQAPQEVPLKEREPATLTGDGPSW